MSSMVEVRVKNTFLDFQVKDTQCGDARVDRARARSLNPDGGPRGDTYEEAQKSRDWSLKTSLAPAKHAPATPCGAVPTVGQAAVGGMPLQRFRLRAYFEGSEQMRCALVRQGTGMNSCADRSETSSLQSSPRSDSSLSMSTMISWDSFLGGANVTSRQARGVRPTVLPTKGRENADVAVMQSACYKRRNHIKEFKHKDVPKVIDLAEKYGAFRKDIPITTVMIRNIPNGYTQREMMSELNGMGFQGKYDFFYLPLDSGTLSNVGYAFVNFADSADAQACMKAFVKYRFKYHRKTSGKVASVSAAHIQGLEANLAHYEKCAVNSPKMKPFRPVVLPVIAMSLSESERT